MQGTELDHIFNNIFPRYFDIYHIDKIKPKKEWKVFVVGDLLLDNPFYDYHLSRTANVKVTFLPNKLAHQLPEVQVNELWMKQSEDWHCYPGNILCWELKERWIDILEEKKRSLEELLTFALTWCLESSASLIGRHWYAHTNRISTWPKEWKFWSHGEAGIREYEQNKPQKEKSRHEKKN